MIHYWWFEISILLKSTFFALPYREDTITHNLWQGRSRIHTSFLFQNGFNSITRGCNLPKLIGNSLRLKQASSLKSPREKKKNVATLNHCRALPVLLAYTGHLPFTQWPWPASVLAVPVSATRRFPTYRKDDLRKCSLDVGCSDWFKDFMCILYIYMGLSENSVPHCTQWFCWSLSLLNGYFIGGYWGYTLFSDKPIWL